MEVIKETYEITQGCPCFMKAPHYPHENLLTLLLSGICFEIQLMLQKIDKKLLVYITTLLHVFLHHLHPCHLVFLFLSGSLFLRKIRRNSVNSLKIRTNIQLFYNNRISQKKKKLLSLKSKFFRN